VKIKKDVMNILIIIFSLLRFINYAYVSTPLHVISAVLILIIVGVSLPTLKRTSLIVVVMMFTVSVILLAVTRADPKFWLAALLQNANIVTLLIFSPMISMPFYYEDYQGELRTMAQIKMKNVMGFLLLVTVSTHLMSVMISVGAMLIMYELMSPFSKLYNADKPFLKTVSRSYFSSGFWSPAWGSVIIYSAYPDVSWVKIIPFGIAFGVIFNLINFASLYIEIKRSPGKYPDIEPEPGAILNKKRLLTMLLMAIGMIGAIAVVNVATGWDLMLVVPLVAIIFPIVIAVFQRHIPEYKKGARSFYDVSLMKVRDQIALFAMSGFLGKSLDLSGVGRLLAGLLPEWLSQTTPLMVAAIALIMVLPSFIGVHPTATGTALVAVLIPSALGLTNYTYALAIVFGWVMGLMMAPFTATAVILSSSSDQSIFKVSTILNWKFGIVCIAVFSVLISIIGPILG